MPTNSVVFPPTRLRPFYSSGSIRPSRWLSPALRRLNLRIILCPVLSSRLCQPIVCVRLSCVCVSTSCARTRVSLCVFSDENVLILSLPQSYLSFRLFQIIDFKVATCPVSDVTTNHRMCVFAGRNVQYLRSTTSASIGRPNCPISENLAK